MPPCFSEDIPHCRPLCADCNGDGSNYPTHCQQSRCGRFLSRNTHPKPTHSKHPIGCIFSSLTVIHLTAGITAYTFSPRREPASHSATRRCCWAGEPAPLYGTHHFCGSDWFAPLTVCLIRGTSPPYEIPLLSEGAGTI